MRYFSNVCIFTVKPCVSFFFFFFFGLQKRAEAEAKAWQEIRMIPASCIWAMLKRKKKKKGYFFIGKLYLHPADLE
jgi:hypothetical protein